MTDSYGIIPTKINLPGIKSLADKQYIAQEYVKIDFDETCFPKVKLNKKEAVVEESAD